MLLRRGASLLKRGLNHSATLAIVPKTKYSLFRLFSATQAAQKSDKSQPTIDNTIPKEDPALEKEEEEDEEEEFEVEATNKKTGFKISNPATFNGKLPFPQIIYDPKSQGFTIEELKEKLSLSDKDVKFVTDFYELKAGQKISNDQLKAVCWHFDHELVEEAIANQFVLQSRPPIVTIMGHVDHGKTTLLDSYRNSELTAAEVGGITQKIGGFMVDTQYGKVSFVDTPGHSLFSNMRRTGATVTDIVILVISAIEGVQSQTLEVLNLIEESNIPVVIAINKIDSAKADPEAVEEQLWQMGVQIEPKGGNVPIIHISAVKRQNTSLLLELVLFEADRLGVKAVTSGSAQAYVLEGKHTDTKNTALIIRKGRLKRGDILIGPNSYCKALKIVDDRGKVLEEAHAGMTVLVQGFKTLPKANDRIITVSSEREAKEYMKIREHAISIQELKSMEGEVIEGTKLKLKNRRERRMLHSGKKEVIEQLYNKKMEELLEQREQILENKKSTEEIDAKIEEHKKTIERFNAKDKVGCKLMFKANDMGTLDTMVTHALNIKDSTGNRNFEIVKAEVGPISDSDLIESLEFEAKIYTMDVSASPEVEGMIKDEGIDVRTFKIIYQFLDDLKILNESMNETYGKITVVGIAAIREMFDIKLNQSSRIKFDLRNHSCLWS